MDLGIAGRRALVCGASAGLGKACARSLATNGVDVVITGRTPATLESAKAEIEAASERPVRTVAGDITTAAGRAAALDACPAPDILITNAGGPPPGDFRDWSRDDWLEALDANMLAPIELIKATVDGMIARRFGRIVNITSAAVKAPIAALGLSNGARAGLTGFVAGLARETVAHNVTINGLLPGPFATDRLWANARATAEKSGKAVDQVYAERRRLHPARRFGEPFEFGEYCAFVCSAQAGYITGQNLLIDGGNYPGTL